jgi:hypothetical protein
MRKVIHSLLILVALFGPSFCCCEAAILTNVVTSITGSSSKDKKSESCCCCNSAGLLKCETHPHSDQPPTPTPDPCACSDQPIDLALIGSQPIHVTTFDWSSNLILDLLPIEMPEVTISVSPFSTGPPIPGGDTRAFMLFNCHRLHC